MTLTEVHNRCPMLIQFSPSILSLPSVLLPPSDTQASDEESDKGQGARPRVGSSREGDVVIDRIRRRIRRQVGEARITPLPPPRQHRILEAVRKMSSPGTDYGFTANVAAVSAVNAGGPIQGMVASRSSPSLMLGGNGIAHGATGTGNGPGLGVAGMILSGLGKGMVEKAAQGMWVGRRNAHYVWV